MTRPTRRAVLAAACGTCAVAVTGCAAYGAGARTVPVAAPPPDRPGEPAAAAIAATTAIPVGGGMIFADLDLVVTQPSAGRFTAFSATCTHQGCAVTDVADGQIVCACHGSTFAVADGAVTGGPATAPLPARAVRVQDGSIVPA